MDNKIMCKLLEYENIHLKLAKIARELKFPKIAEIHQKPRLNRAKLYKYNFR